MRQHNTFEKIFLTYNMIFLLYMRIDINASIFLLLNIKAFFTKFIKNET